MPKFDVDSQWLEKIASNVSICFLEVDEAARVTQRITSLLKALVGA